MRCPYRKIFKSTFLLRVVVFLAIILLWGSYRHGIFSREDKKVTDDQQKNILSSDQSEKQKSQLTGQGQTKCGIPRAVAMLNKTVILNQEPMCGWLKARTEESQGQFQNYGKTFARLSNVVIDPEMATGSRGGESLNDVIGQKEENEFLQLKSGYFTLKCDTPPKVGFQKKDHLISWNKMVVCAKEHTAKHRFKGMTLAVMRYEYANFYHTMTDYYNAFLITLIFNQHPDNVTILWIDGHPKGSLELTWDILFGETVRAGHLKGPTIFDDMVWSITGYFSPLMQHQLQSVPYLEEFREFVLSRHGLFPVEKEFNCTSLNILFIWRRDYVAHPRNPKGIVKRKIENEDEIIKNVKSNFPDHNITALQLDTLPMKMQLHLITDTDILVGMHGAGLSHTLFLPKHAGLVELYPKYMGMGNHHFKVMASWRHLPYRVWQNKDPRNEKENFSTYIPVDKVNKLLQTMQSTLCNSGVILFTLFHWIILFVVIFHYILQIFS